MFRLESNIVSLFGHAVQNQRPPNLLCTRLKDQSDRAVATCASTIEKQSCVYNTLYQVVRRWQQHCQQYPLVQYPQAKACKQSVC